MTARRYLPPLLLLILVGAFACRGPRPAGPTASCTHLQAVREMRGAALCQDVWTCARPPEGPFDRIGLHRLAPCEAPPGPVVLYLPGMHMTGELPADDPRHDLRLHLAAAGLRTWGVDYRTHAVPDHADPAALEALGRWTAETFADDAAWAVGFVRAADSGPLYLAGFSHGAALAYQLAARQPDALAGLVVLDGALPPARPGGGTGVIDVGSTRLPFAARDALLAAVIADPASPSPVPGFTTAGEALAHILYSAPSFGGQGGLANTKDDVSDLRVLARLLRSYDRWWPRAALPADPPAPSRPLPVLAFASGRLGPAWNERVRASAAAFGGDRARVVALPAYGHLDVLVGREAADDVFRPVLDWLGTPPR
jgi:pimeloyl-ACP methyl ester carboxylesterase